MSLGLWQQYQIPQTDNVFVALKCIIFSTLYRVLVYESGDKKFEVETNTLISTVIRNKGYYSLP